MLNKFEFIGNLTKDLELRKTGSGKSVVNLDIALNYYVQNEKKTEYVQVVAWDKQAEDASSYLSKGRQIYAEGKVVVRKREIDGKKIPIPEFHADKILYLGSPNQNGSGQQGANEHYNTQHRTNDYQSDDQGFGQESPYNNNVFGQSTNYNRNSDPNFPFGR